MVNVSVSERDGGGAIWAFSMSTFRVVSADEMKASDLGSCFLVFVEQEKAVKVNSSKCLSDGCI